MNEQERKASLGRPLPSRTSLSSFSSSQISKNTRSFLKQRPHPHPPG